jgi:hypothetical protein
LFNNRYKYYESSQGYKKEGELMKLLLILLAVSFINSPAKAGYETICHWVSHQVCTTSTKMEKVCHKVPDKSDDGYDVVCDHFPKTTTTCHDDPEYVCEQVWVNN